VQGVYRPGRVSSDDVFPEENRPRGAARAGYIDVTGDPALGKRYPGSDVGPGVDCELPGLESINRGLDQWLLLAVRMVRGAMPKRQASDTRRVLIGLAGLAVLLLVVACNEGSSGAPCLPEDVERCTCDDGRDGFEVCDPDGGGGYGACNCDLDASPYLPEAGEEASSDAAEADGGGGALVFMSSCSTASGSPPCPSGTSCDPFPAKGQFCSKPCKLPTDCPPPSPGCNMMGTCKPP